ncbi:MAG: DUF4405 domain-containing protein [Coriobacteriia bacterium]|nr:DUF4405 domain-containing protein [Coriobacteriia bacterium]
MADKRPDQGSPAVALLMVLVVLAFAVGVGTRAIDLRIAIGPWLLHHWFSWTGATFIAAFTPAFYVLKRRNRDGRRALLQLHVFGGLVAVGLVSLHFTQHVTRPVPPDLGTGVVLYAALVLSVTTGFLMRYRMLTAGMREWRLIHNGSAVTFYLAIVVHVMVGLGVL